MLLFQRVLALLVFAFAKNFHETNTDDNVTVAMRYSSRLVVIDGTINVRLTITVEAFVQNSQQKGPMNYSRCGFVSPTQHEIYYLVIK